MEKLQFDVITKENRIMVKPHGSTFVRWLIKIVYCNLMSWSKKVFLILINYSLDKSFCKGKDL